MIRLDDDSLLRQGYIHVRGVLAESELAACRAVFDAECTALSREIGDGWFPTIMLPDSAARDRIDAGLRAAVAESLVAAVDLAGHELIRLDFSVKPATETSGLGPHQDYSMVDEANSRSAYFWLPLCDTDARNGTLSVVPGSHRFSNRYRSRHVVAQFDEALDLVESASVTLDCAAGDLVVMTAGIIHWSAPNRSDQVRLAVHGNAVPAGQPLVYCYVDDNTPAGCIELHEMGIAEYLDAIRAGPSRLSSSTVRLVDRPVGSMTRARFLAGMNQIVDPSPPIAEKSKRSRRISSRRA